MKRTSHSLSHLASLLATRKVTRLVWRLSLCLVLCFLNPGTLHADKPFLGVNLIIKQVEKGQIFAVKSSACSPFPAVSGKTYLLKHHLWPPKMAWNCWSIQAVKEKNLFTFTHKEVKAELSLWRGLRFMGKFLFHTMHWADVISNDAHKCSTTLE